MYLAGLLTPASHELELTGTGMPSWASEGVVAAAFGAGADRLGCNVCFTGGRLARTVAMREADVAATPSAPAPDLAAIAAAIAPLTTLRTALLSWNVDAAMPTFAEAPSVEHGPERADHQHAPHAR